MTDIATLEARLTESETALHKLMTGAGVAKVSYEGEATEYTRASVPELRRYIASLKRQLGQDVGAGSRGVVL